MANQMLSFFISSLDCVTKLADGFKLKYEFRESPGIT